MDGKSKMVRNSFYGDELGVEEKVKDQSDHVITQALAGLASS